MVFGALGERNNLRCVLAPSLSTGLSLSPFLSFKNLSPSQNPHLHIVSRPRWRRRDESSRALKRSVAGCRLQAVDGRRLQLAGGVPRAPGGQGSRWRADMSHLTLEEEAVEVGGGGGVSGCQRGGAGERRHIWNILPVSTRPTVGDARNEVGDFSKTTRKHATLTPSQNPLKRRLSRLLTQRKASIPMKRAAQRKEFCSCENSSDAHIFQIPYENQYFRGRYCKYLYRCQYCIFFPPVNKKLKIKRHT